MDKIAAKKGEFTLFALLRRADALGGWDLVVSAPWLESGNLKATRGLVRMLARWMGEESLQQFSRVVALDSDEPRVRFIRENFPVRKGEGERTVQSIDLLGLQIEKAIILRAEKPRSRPAVLPNTASHALVQSLRRS
jgi:hypothetical protein